jgi:hypothetical protein
MKDGVTGRRKCCDKLKQIVDDIMGWTCGTHEKVSNTTKFCSETAMKEDLGLEGTIEPDIRTYEYIRESVH